MSRSALVLSCLVHLGCGMVLGIDDLVADRTAAEGGDCFDVCGTAGCGECPAPAAVAVMDAPTPFRIDAHEVTNDEYKAFLDAGVATAVQDDICQYNASFEPGVVPRETIDLLIAEGAPTTDLTNALEECAGWLDRELESFGGKRPIGCVDVCDARAYCTWAKKRLCGRIGGDVLPFMNEAEGVHIDADQNEWYRACSNGGTQLFPYGPAYAPERCIDAGKNPNIIYDVDQYLECEGGYTGLFHMSGNVGEWENTCSTYGNHPAAKNCLVRGGAYYNGGFADDGSLLTCTVFRDNLQSAPSPSTGFRCCSDP